MPLDDLRKKLFRGGSDFSRRTQEPKLEKHKDAPPTSWEHEEGDNAAKIIERNRKIMKWGIGGGVALIVLALVGLFIWFGGFGGSNTQKLLELTIEGGEEITAGKKVLWKIKYHNKNQINLDDVVLTFQFPENAQPLVGEFSQDGLRREQRKLGNIAPGESGEEIFSALLFGAKDEILTGHVVMEYRPESSSARLTKDIDYSSRVTSTLLGLELEIPEALKSGQEADMTLRVTNSSDTTFRGLTVGIDYPEPFEFTFAEPEPARGNALWNIGDLAPGAEYVVIIRGRVTDSASVETFRSKVGIYDRIENTLSDFNEIVQSFQTTDALLAIQAFVKRGEEYPGVVVAGDRVEVEVAWKNHLPVSITNVVLEVALRGSAIDLKTLEGLDGEYSASTNSLRWIPGRIPELSVIDSGEEGKFRFWFRTKEEIPISGFGDREFTVGLEGRVASFDVPSGYEGVDISGRSFKEYKVASNPTLFQKGYYNDSRIVNTGPIPPKVGQETTYLIVWSLINTVNDIEDVVVRATVPSYVRWTGRVIPPDPSLSFDPSTRVLEWRPGVIFAGTGQIRPAREVAFQIGHTPSLPQIGDRPELISDAILTAIDSFTDAPFEREAEKVTTLLPDDDSLPRGGGPVEE